MPTLTTLVVVVERRVTKEMRPAETSRTSRTSRTNRTSRFGDTGSQGLKRDKGQQGLKGNKGDTGPAGPRGPKGNKGDQGKPSPKCNKGDTVPVGPLYGRIIGSKKKKIIRTDDRLKNQDINLDNHKVNNLPTPTNNNDAATKKYVGDKKCVFKNGLRSSISNLA